MKPEEILKNYQLRVTNARVKVLEIFQKNPFALSQPFLEKNVETTDRVTLYRTLNTFEKVGLIHKVLDDTYTLKYALCSKVCSDSNILHHKHEHIHFQCSKCNQTTCLNVQIPLIQLPEDYIAHEVHFSMKGICKNCLNSLSNPNS